MSLETDDVIAWLLELHQIEAAALLSEAEFEYTFIDTAFRLDAMDDETDILELSILFPPRIYRDISGKFKEQADQIDAAVSELTRHTKGSWIRSTSWGLKMPKLDEVQSLPDTEDLLSDSSLHDVQRLWTKAKARVLTDPDGAITASRTMLESLCKIIITEKEGTFTNKDDLPSLYAKAVSSLSFAPNQQTEYDYRKLAGSCTTIMNSIATIRNREGDSHGGSFKTQVVHARFVVNVSGSLVSVLVGLKNEKI